MAGASISESSSEGIGSSRKRKLSPTSSGNGTKKLSTMLFDPDSLHCPICVEVLTIPIFQCDNGHLACSSCCPKLRNKCASCALPIGHSRCRAMETVLESVFVPCLNSSLGCTKNISYGNEVAHDEECEFAICLCPVKGCNYPDMYKEIYNHYNRNHSQRSRRETICCGIPFSAKMSISDKILIKREHNKSLLFAVQCFREQYGVYVTVSCIAPPAPEVGEFPYHLSYTVDGHTMIYKSPKMKMVFEVSSEIPQENFMLIPHSLLRGDVLEMEICICKLKKE
ncbi:hypothetical protein AALP_AA5G223900 [Arabis alpina]|uniref:RING-type E3 ubiquitin transferase n=1 Tax=Arabis alpina TaxID=50452 RepID=A0A087GYR9_ARAAL|nr:hypothetical protein AALP_AA5G223900 [Arabis alpina]